MTQKTCAQVFDKMLPSVPKHKQLILNTPAKFFNTQNINIKGGKALVSIYFPTTQHTKAQSSRHN
jgi:hypothetical protein